MSHAPSGPHGKSSAIASSSGHPVHLRTKAAIVAFIGQDTPERVEGAAVGERFRSLFAEVRSTRPGPPYLHLQPRELRVEVVGDAGLVTFPLGRAPGDVSRRTLLFVRERGAWKLRHMHASNMLAAAPPK